MYMNIVSLFVLLLVSFIVYLLIEGFFVFAENFCDWVDSIRKNRIIEEKED